MKYVTRELTIWNKYVSNGYDNYDDEIEVNLKLGSQGWFWLYDSGDRVKIYNNSSFNWKLSFPKILTVYMFTLGSIIPKT